MRLIIKILIVFTIISCGSNDNNDKYYNLACQAEEEGDYKLAIEFLNQALEINPNDLSSLNNHGWDRLDLGDTIGAMQDFATMIQVDSTCDMGYYNRGNILVHMQEYQAALDDFNKAADIKNIGPIYLELTNNDFIEQPDKPVAPIGDLFYWKGVANYYTQNYTDAFKDFSFCISRGDYLAKSHYMRAFIYFRADDSDNGCKDLEKSIFYGYDEALPEYNKFCD